MNDPSYWPDASQLSVGLVGLGSGRVHVDDGDPIPVRYALDEQARQRLVAPARELVEFLLEDRIRIYGPFAALVAARLAGMDADVHAKITEGRGPIAVAELELLLGWDVERRALFAEAVRGRPDHVTSLHGVTEWLGGLPGYPDFARTALEAAGTRVAAIHAGGIPCRAEKAFTREETATLGRAVRLALLKDEPWLPDLLGELLPGVAVAPTQAKTLPSQGLLFEVARAMEEYPTPEAVSALYAARRATRHAGVPLQLDRKFKRIEPVLADRLEVAFRLPDGRLRQAVGEHTAVLSTDGGIELSWWHEDRKLKGVPAAVRREHPEEVKRLREPAKQARQRKTTLIRALEAGYTSRTAPPYRQLEGHPVTDRLIWEFEVSPGVWRSELGLTVPDVPVRLWHPARAPVEEVRAWREAVQDKELRQPFKQAFREVYLLTPAEEAAGTRSGRFAEHVVDYRRLRALFKDRGWRSDFLGHRQGDGEARRVLAGGHWRATLDHYLHDEHHAITGEIRFQRLTEGAWHQVPLAEVPALVFGEAMRDVDLFVAVTSIGLNAQAAGGHEDYWHSSVTSEETPAFRRGRNRTPAEQDRGRRLAARRTAVKTPHDIARFDRVFGGGDNQATERTIRNTLAVGPAER